jgi:hypothetical protein
VSVIAVITTIDLKEPWTLEQASQRFDKSTPKYREIPGLHRKYFTITPSGDQAVGVYLWRSREDAENLYTPEWLADQEQRLGAPVQLKWLHCGAVVDNVTGEIVR